MPAAQKPIALISMPTLSGRFPCFQLGLLKPTLERSGYHVQNFSLYMYFGGYIGWRLHESLSEVTAALTGEWIWAKAAFGDFASEDSYFAEHKSCVDSLCKTSNCTIADLHRIRNEVVPDFLNFCLNATDWGRFGVIGFTILFQQQLASLAFARELKKKYPRIPIILGGGTLEEDIAEEILRECPQIDFVHCGEADQTFAEFIRRCYAGESMEGLPGIMRYENDSIDYGGRAPNLMDLNSTPVPDFDEYFFAREESGYSKYSGALSPMLPIETARGCWWGEKSHCIFCGLNRDGMQFRSRHPENVLHMLEVLHARHGISAFNALDNIMAPSYMDTLFRTLAEQRKGFHLHYEVKANIKRDQLWKMKRGGLFSIQPGIESFSTNLLQRMRKGSTGMQNLELLKWSTSFGITNLYNILFGFPGETEHDYDLQCKLIMQIPHLQPPYAISMARPDRGSPMFSSPADFGITRLIPAPCYEWLYPSARFNLQRVSYYFDHRMTGILTARQYQAIYNHVTQWKRRWQTSPRPFLNYRKTSESFVIDDGRGNALRQQIYNDREAELYEFLQDAQNRRSIEKRFASHGEDWIDGTLKRFNSDGFITHLDGKYLALALPKNG
jgi:ribosomal peptide maturation radical SAM protein 1